jgi:hypothetical protein
MLRRVGTLLAAVGVAVAVSTAPVTAASQPDDGTPAARRELARTLARSMSASTYSSAASTDPTGDVTDARADITEVKARLTPQTLVLQARIPGGTNPSTDPDWGGGPFEGGGISLGFAVGVTSPPSERSYPDFLAYLYRGPDGIEADLDGYGASVEREVCTHVSATFETGGLYTVKVPSKCFANVQGVRVAAGLIIYEQSFFPAPGFEEPIVDVAPDNGAISVTGFPGGNLVANDQGGLYSLGTLRSRGSLGKTPLARPIVDITANANRSGYLMLGDDGGVFRFGNVGFYGSAAGRAVNAQ